MPPAGVSFGNASVVFASSLNLTNGTGQGWNWSYNSTGVFNGPCNGSGIHLGNGTYAAHDNASSAVNLTGNVTLICLNSVNNGVTNATWYFNSTGAPTTFNTYTSTGVVNGSYYNASGVNVSSCSNWSMFHNINTTTFNGSYLPCNTYFEQNNNTAWLPSFSGNNSTLWSPNQTGYAPNDLLYVVPIDFSNTAASGTYELSVAIAGVTPVAQSFFVNDTTGVNNTVLFTFDMTTAWLMDLSVTNLTPFNQSSMAIYASIGVASSIVTLCGFGASGAVCPVVTRP